MTRWCLLQALVAENAAASEQLNRLEDQLSGVNFSLGVLLQQVSQHLLNSSWLLKPGAEISLLMFPEPDGRDA